MEVFAGLCLSFLQSYGAFHMTRWIMFVAIVAVGTVPALAHTPFSTEFRKRLIQAPDDALATFYGSVENSEKFTSWARSTSKMGSCKICHGTKKQSETPLHRRFRAVSASILRTLTIVSRRSGVLRRPSAASG